MAIKLEMSVSDGVMAMVGLGGIGKMGKKHYQLIVPIVEIITSVVF